MLKRAGPILFLFSLTLLMAVPSAKATTLLPGSTVPATPIFITPGTLVLVADTGINTYHATGDLFHGRYRELVISGDPTNLFGPSALTFLFAVGNDSTSRDSIDRITLASFTGFDTNVWYEPALTTDGFFGTTSGTYTDVVPNTVDRTSDGAIVGFNWSDPLLRVSPGKGSSVLVIQTNATATTNTGILSAHNRVAADILPVYEPTGKPLTAVEPASALLLGVSLLMGGVFRKKLFA